MKRRSPETPGPHGREFKGVVKKMTGKLTSDPGLEREGRDEMAGRSASAQRRKLDPDPHRRG